MRTGSPIVYTSADSVFQVAAHEEVIPLWELYKICETAREILRGPAEVGRVIARPFVGTPGHFTRTSNRHDYAVPPPSGMLLDRLSESGIGVHSVGKIFDVFLGRGIEDSVKIRSNADGMAKTLDAMSQYESGLIFVNWSISTSSTDTATISPAMAPHSKSSIAGCRSSAPRCALATWRFSRRPWVRPHRSRH